MKKITIHQDENATLVYYPETKIVYNTFHKQTTSEVFRQVLNAGAEAMKKYGGTKWLSDDREHMAAFTPEDRDWADNDWYPRVVAAGWKTWALVVPRDLIARFNMKEIIEENFRKGIRIMVFSDPDEALKWLLTIKDN